MLGKIILTLLVMVLAIVVLRQRALDRRSTQATTATRDAGGDGRGRPIPSDQRLAAYLFLILMFAAAAILYYRRWQDDHTVLTVSLYRDDASSPSTFQVYKYQLDSRAFTTIDGIRITVADTERMEVLIPD